MRRAGIIAKKVGTTSIFNDTGFRCPVTILSVDKCQVVAHRTQEKNGYNALVLGVTDVKQSKISKSLRNVFNTVKLNPKAKLKEFRISKDCFLDIGSDIKPDHFVQNQFVDVTANTIGKGYAGAMKRHHFRGLEASHGVSISHRAHGSTGGCQEPGRVFKNKKMAGHMGNSQVTVHNLRVIEIDNDASIIVISGVVPGAVGGYVYIKDAVKHIA